MIMGTICIHDKKVQFKDNKNSFDKMSSKSLFDDLKKSVKVLSPEQLKESRNPLYTYLI